MSFPHLYAVPDNSISYPTLPPTGEKEEEQVNSLFQHPVEPEKEEEGQIHILLESSAETDKVDEAQNSRELPLPESSKTEKVAQKAGWFSWVFGPPTDPIEKELKLAKGKIPEKLRLIPKGGYLRDQLETIQTERLKHYCARYMTAFDKKTSDLPFQEKVVAVKKELFNLRSDPILEKSHPNGRWLTEISLKAPARDLLEESLVSAMKTQFYLGKSSLLNDIQEGAKEINRCVDAELPLPAYGRTLIKKIFDSPEKMLETLEKNLGQANGALHIPPEGESASALVKNKIEALREVHFYLNAHGERNHSYSKV